MVELYLDVGAFSGLIDTLDSAAGDMLTASKRLSDADRKDLGNAFIESAATHFVDRWNYGIEQIAEVTSEMVPSLEATRDLYLIQEHAIADQLEQLLPVPEQPGGRDLEESTPASGGSSLNMGTK